MRYSAFTNEKDPSFGRQLILSNVEDIDELAAYFINRAWRYGSHMPAGQNIGANLDRVVVYTDSFSKF